MGVQIYLLDRRTVTLNIDGHDHAIGTLRRSWKITEVDNVRAAEIEAEKQKLSTMEKPIAALVTDVIELALASDPERSVAGHIVLGWDADRVEVTNSGWDYLPVLGYAIRDPASNNFILYDNLDGKVAPLGEERAMALGIISANGKLIRRGQPTIANCISVRPFITNRVEADCVLSDGQSARLLTFVDPENPPDKKWYVGKRPSDVANYAGEGHQPHA
jgi:hypothetical protein